MSWQALVVAVVAGITGEDLDVQAAVQFEKYVRGPGGRVTRTVLGRCVGFNQTMVDEALGAPFVLASVSFLGDERGTRGDVDLEAEIERARRAPGREEGDDPVRVSLPLKVSIRNVATSLTAVRHGLELPDLTLPTGVDRQELLEQLRAGVDHDEVLERLQAEGLFWDVQAVLEHRCEVIGVALQQAISVERLYLDELYKPDRAFHAPPGAKYRYHLPIPGLWERLEAVADARRAALLGAE